MPFDAVSYVMGTKAGGGGGVTVEELNVTENDTYTADAGKAFNPVNVSVPNSYTAGDEGKVVSNGALVAQTAHAEVTQNGTVDTTLNNSVAVNVQEPVIPAPIKDVVFVDYDGEIVYEYTAQEFLALSALPANPSHTGLTAQGWNWTLADAQAYVRSYGCLCIGQNYTTSDGKTRIYVDITDVNNRGSFGINIVANQANTPITVDWGDGTSQTKTLGSGGYGETFTHGVDYAVGKYVITISISSGTYLLGNPNINRGVFEGGFYNRPIVSSVYAIEIGTGVTGFNRQALNYVPNLDTISIPSTMTGFAPTGGIFSVKAPQCFVVPSGVTTIAMGVAPIKFLAVPKSLTSGIIARTSLRALTVPQGNWSTTSAYGLRFSERISIPFTSTSVGSGAAGGKFLISSLCKKLIIPNTVTEIKAYALEAVNVDELHFQSTTPPTLANTNALANAQVSRIIYVPYSADHSILEAYKTASNWSTYASEMQEEPQ